MELAHGIFFAFPHITKISIFKPGSPTALHPPLYVFILAFFDLLQLRTVHDELIINCVEGAVAVGFLVATSAILLGEVGSIITGTIASLDPGLLVFDGVGLAEQSEMLIISILIYLLYLSYEKPKISRGILIGSLCALAALSRAEQMLLVVILIPYFIFKLKLEKQDLMKFVLAVYLAFILVVGPWVIRNIVEFNPPEFISTELGVTLQTANCNQTYFGPYRGYWYYNCYKNISVPPNEAAADVTWRNSAISFISHHFRAFLEVIPIRVARNFYVYRPYEQAALNVSLEGVPYSLGKPVIWCDWLLEALSAIGVFAIVKKRKLLSPLLFQFFVLVLISAAFSGDSRYRANFELSLAILASAGLVIPIAGFLNLLKKPQ